jgi:hypothetical protein
MNIHRLAARTLFFAVACLAIVAPAASARPIPNAPFHTAAAPLTVTATGGFDWVTAAIGAAALAGVLGLIWLAAAAIGRVTRPPVAHR